MSCSTATSSATRPDIDAAYSHIQSIRDGGLPSNPFHDSFSAPAPRPAFHRASSYTPTSSTYAFGAAPLAKRSASLPAPIPATSPLYAPRTAARMWEIKRWQRANEAQFLVESLRHVHALGGIAEASNELPKYLAFATSTFSQAYSACFGTGPGKINLLSASTPKPAWEPRMLESWVYVRRCESALALARPVSPIMPSALGFSFPPPPQSGRSSPAPSASATSRSSIFSRRSSVDSQHTKVDPEDTFSPAILRQMMDAWLAECVSHVDTQLDRVRYTVPSHTPFICEPESYAGSSRRPSISSCASATTLASTKSAGTAEAWWIEMAEDVRDEKDLKREELPVKGLQLFAKRKPSGESLMRGKGKKMSNPFVIIKNACRPSRKPSHSEHLAYSSLA